MKKLLNVSFGYFIAAMIAGVFYREFTKYMGFSGKTTLAVMHTHLLMLGTLIFLILALFRKTKELQTIKKFRIFFVLQNIAVPLMTLTFLARGIVQVLAFSVSKVMDASISGIAGISHILLAISLTFLFLSLKELAANEEK